MIKMKNSILVFLAIALAGCAPTLFGSKEWVRISMLPSREERSTACDRGISSGAARNFNAILAGVADLPSPTGDLTFFSALGSTYTFCYLQGLGGFRTDGIPSGPAFITFTPDGTPAPKIYVVFKDENNVELGKLEPSDSYMEKGDMFYSFRKFSGTTIEKMTKAAVLEVAVLQGEKEDRYKVTPDMFGAPLQTKPSPQQLKVIELVSLRQ
jgi:hypothetical protein